MEDPKGIGRDELNLAELPIALLADRAPSGVNTVVMRGQHGTLTISGAELPTALDTDVIVGLLHLTKLHNNFENATVPFVQLELMNIIGWPNRGQYYQRLKDSLKRWVGVTLNYEGAFWDVSLKCRVDATFHVLDDVTIFNEDVKRTLRARHQPLPPSTFTWGKRFFQSLQAGNLRPLDLDIYFGLESSISKQMYRFVQKRFHQRADWTFDLNEFAFGHLGLSQNYTAGEIKRRLKPAIEELTRVGLLKSATYSSPKRGSWTIRLVGKSKAGGGHS
jgi:hypothetical protein